METGDALGEEAVFGEDKRDARSPEEGCHKEAGSADQSDRVDEDGEPGPTDVGRDGSPGSVTPRLVVRVGDESDESGE